MIQAPHTLVDRHGASVVRDRCRALGLGVWRLRLDGTVVESPAEQGLAGDWFRAAPLSRLVASATLQWQSDPSPGPVEVFPGCWAIPCVERVRRVRTGYTVAVALGPDALHAEQFGACCQAAALDAAAMRSLLRGRATHTPELVERTATMLGWLVEDLEAVDAQEQSLSVFSRQLAESYEEITLLYTLGQSMNQLSHPENFVRLCVRELHETLAYEWIALGFVADQRRARAMGGRLLTAGRTPLDEAGFQREIGRLVAGAAAPGNVVIAGEARGPLAQGDSQILAHPVARDGQVVGVLFAGHKLGDDPQVSSADIKLLDAAAGYLSVLLDNAFLYDDQQLMFIGTLESLTAAIDAKDPYTCGHSERVAHLAAALAQAHGLDEEQVERIRIAGLVHDVGKIGVPDFVLGKTGRLTEEEFRLIKAHPEIGFHILKDIPLMEDILPGVLHHHERIDGRGYPHGLRGDAIPLVARIIGLADSFDAMSSNRTYRSAMPRARVLEELGENAGSQFDPALVESFARVDLSRYDELVERHSGQSAAGGLRIPRAGLAA
ncbi:MAG TPA: hypothetical protein DEB06_06400 [Phycisphaerales bacterium]|nr:hypothetical protein [Phycisphaerales bacterium]